MYSSSVTDAQWAILGPLLPAPGSTAGRGGRPEKHCRRVVVVLYIVRGGIAIRQPDNAAGSVKGTVKLVSCLVAAKIGGRDRCIVVVQGSPVPAGDHRPLRVAVSPGSAELS